MDNVNELEKKAEDHILALQEIIDSLKSDIDKQGKLVSFEQVKEIESTILRLNRQGLPIPTELKELKLKLLSQLDQHKKRIDLLKKLQIGISELHEIATIKMPRGTILKNNDHHRKPANNERPLGSKGNSNLDDYLIPVIRLMWKGLDHVEAFSKVAQVLDVRYNTVSSQCTRALDLTTDEFDAQVNSKMIISLLKKKYPDQHQKIKIELME